MSNPMDDSNMQEGEQEQQQRSREELIREVLPACQPQEGSPANTFTVSELQELQAALNLKEIGSLIAKKSGEADKKQPARLDICDAWTNPNEPEEKLVDTDDSKMTTTTTLISSCGNPNDEEFDAPPQEKESISYTLPRTFRQAVREGNFHGPTNGVCPGYLQCNLVVLPAGKIAFDFLLFCQRNAKACPLLEVCEGKLAPHPQHLADGVDLRTDIPKYAIYRDGKLEQEVSDCTSFWPEDAVSFLIGCSFSYDGALLNAGIPLRSAEAGKNVPMYKTNLACTPSGSLHGHTVVSMKPIPAMMVAKEIEITNKYTHAHGGPVCVGCPGAIGIADLDNPEWGDAIDVKDDEIPVFHACGVTPQSVLMESKIPFAITHAAGHMFVSDQPADMGVL